MKQRVFVPTCVALGLATLMTISSSAHAAARARLDGYQENPSISTAASGLFRAKLNRSKSAINFKLSYENIETSVRFAHIHLARRHVNGGIVVWLCDNTGNAPIEVDICPNGSGSVEGVITPASVTGADPQGLAAGEFEELLKAVGNRATYINIHTDAFPSGELRGQILGKRRRHEDD